MLECIDMKYAVRAMTTSFFFMVQTSCHVHSLPLLTDTGASHRQLVGNSLPRIGFVAGPVDFNLEVDGLGHHVGHLTLTALCILNHLRVSVFLNVRSATKKTKCRRINIRAVIVFQFSD